MLGREARELAKQLFAWLAETAAPGEINPEMERIRALLALFILHAFDATPGDERLRELGDMIAVHPAVKWDANESRACDEMNFDPWLAVMTEVLVPRRETFRDIERVLEAVERPWPDPPPSPLPTY